MIKSYLFINNNYNFYCVNGFIDLSSILLFHTKNSINPYRIYDNLGNPDTLKKIKKKLNGLKGIYGFFL
jgi:hypothetical protein